MFRKPKIYIYRCYARLQLIRDQKDSRRFKKIQEGFRRFKKIKKFKIVQDVQEGSIRIKKVKEC